MVFGILHNGFIAGFAGLSKWLKVCHHVKNHVIIALG